MREPNHYFLADVFRQRCFKVVVRGNGCPNGVFIHLPIPRFQPHIGSLADHTFDVGRRPSHPLLRHNSVNSHQNVTGSFRSYLAIGFNTTSEFCLKRHCEIKVGGCFKDSIVSELSLDNVKGIVQNDCDACLFRRCLEPRQEFSLPDT